MTFQFVRDPYNIRPDVVNRDGAGGGWIWAPFSPSLSTQPISTGGVGGGIQSEKLNPCPCFLGCSLFCMLIIPSTAFLAYGSTLFGDFGNFTHDGKTGAIAAGIALGGVCCISLCCLSMWSYIAKKESDLQVTQKAHKAIQKAPVEKTTLSPDQKV